MLFEHLIDPAFEVIDDLPAEAIFNAQVETLDWLDDDTAPVTGAPPKPRDSALAQQAFAALTAGAPPDKQLTDIKNLRTPAAVRHLVGMLSAYDWDFVEQAKQLRGFVVAKLLEETKDPVARNRLKALELIGKITEVAAFTERSEVTHKNEDSSVIEERLRAKLKSLLPPTIEVQDAEVKEIAIVARVAPTYAKDT